MAHETKKIAGFASDVFPRVLDMILAGWHVYGQLGIARCGCDAVDVIEVYLVREVYPSGKSLLPDLSDLEERQE